MFDEVFEHLVITPASEDGTIKNRGRRSAAKVSSEDRGSESLGSLPLFEAEGYSRACRVARKKFINLCYQVCIYTSHSDVFNQNYDFCVH